MSLNKAIEHGKDHRKPFIDQRIIFGQCRNHGKCRECTGNRLYANKKRSMSMESKLKEYKNAV